MQRHVLILVLAGALSTEVLGQTVIDYELGWWFWPPQTCMLTPPEPTCADPLTITVGGDWPESCPPNASETAVTGNEIHLDVILNYPPNIYCLSVITPWSLSAVVDPLAPGLYTIQGTLLGHYLVPETPTPLMTFTVAPKSADMDDDGDVDLHDYTMFAHCVTGPGGGVLSGCGGADLDGDDDVDLRDYRIFQLSFRPSPPPHIRDYSNSGCLGGSRDAYPGCGEDRIEVAVAGDTLHVTHRSATYNCCPDDIVISLWIEGNVLRLTEEEILTMPCYCLCCYDVEATVAGLCPGSYLLRFCWDDSETQEEQCYIEDIVIR